MKLLRPLGLSLLVLFGLLGGLSGCLTAPTYPVEPSIEFSDLAVTRFYPPSPQPPVDTFKITVSFRDGDGDLGLTQTEINKPPYTGLNAFNYYIQLFRRDPQTKQFVALREGEDYANFPPIYQGDYKAAPLKGDLRFRLALTYGSPLLAGDEVRFQVSIKDRALHQSNTVTTDTKTVAKR